MSSSISFSFGRGSNDEVFFYSIKNIEKSLDNGLISLDISRSFKDGSHKSDESTISMSDTLSGGLEFLDSKKDSRLDASLGFEE